MHEQVVHELVRHNNVLIMDVTKRDKFLLSLIVATLAVLLSATASYFLYISIYYLAPIALIPAYFIRRRLDVFLLILFTALLTILMHDIPYFTPILFSIMMLLVPIYVAMRSRSMMEALASLGFRGSPIRAFVIALLSLVPAGMILFLLSLIAVYMGANDASKVDAKVSSLPIYVLVYAVTIGPLAEEVFFRSFLPLYMHPIIASLFFAFAHFSYGSSFEIVGAFVMGLLLYVLYKLSGDIKAAIFAHMMINIISLYVMVGM